MLDLTKLTTAEQKLLEALRSGRYEHINIKTTDGAIDRIDLQERLTNYSIQYAIKETDYQNLAIQVHGGRVVNIRRTSKIKF